VSRVTRGNNSLFNPGTPLRELSALWRTMLRALFDPYRPELHYMRGYGPKCREAALQRNIGRSSSELRELVHGRCCVRSIR
jgi:hypothetical protein